MGGIYVGGMYVPNSITLVSTYAYSKTLMKWYYPANRAFSRNTLRSIPGTGIMHLSAPELLAFWSEEE